MASDGSLSGANSYGERAIVIVRLTIADGPNNWLIMARIGLRIPDQGRVINELWPRMVNQY